MEMTPEDYDVLIETLAVRINELRPQTEQARNDFAASGYEDHDAMERYESLSAQLMQAHDDNVKAHEGRMKALAAKREAEKLERERFNRPQNGLLGLLSRPLGPLPHNAQKVHPTKDAVAELPSYRVPGLLLLGCAIAGLLAMTYFLPWLVISPTIIIADLLIPIMGDTPGNIATAIITFALMGLLSRGSPDPSYGGGFIDGMAVLEEQWFRMGAESWTFRQKAYSCASFGLMHTVNVFYPVTSLLILMLVGLAFMAAYLREFRRSGSRERAVLASAKLHAAYNRFAFAFTAVAIATMLGSMFL